MNNMNQWEKNAELYKCYFEEDDNRVSSTMVFPMALNLLGEMKNKKILDLGCGQGRFSRIFYDMGASSVIACDISQKELEIAISLDNDRGINYSFCNEALKESNNYDLVFSFMVLLCNPYDEACKLLEKVYNSLKEGGKVCFVNTNTDELGVKFKDFYSKVPSEKIKGTPYETIIPTKKGNIVVNDHYYSPKHLQDMYIRAGFKITHQQIIEKQFILHILEK